MDYATPATAVTVVGHLVVFGLGWAACLWRNRNRVKVKAIEAMIVQAAKDGDAKLHDALAVVKGVILRESTEK
jgi:hypothetical protein